MEVITSNLSKRTFVFRLWDSREDHSNGIKWALYYTMRCMSRNTSYICRETCITDVALLSQSSEFAAASSNSAACFSKESLSALFSSAYSTVFTLTCTFSPLSLSLPHSFPVQTQLCCLPWSKQRVLWQHELGLQCGRSTVGGENGRNSAEIKDTPLHLGYVRELFPSAELCLCGSSLEEFVFSFTNL